eukprot:3135616-Pyramimonas_sp.AAC.1
MSMIEVTQRWGVVHFVECRALAKGCCWMSTINPMPATFVSCSDSVESKVVEGESTVDMGESTVDKGACTVNKGASTVDNKGPSTVGKGESTVDKGESTVDKGESV